MKASKNSQFEQYAGEKYNQEHPQREAFNYVPETIGDWISYEQQIEMHNKLTALVERTQRQFRGQD